MKTNKFTKYPKQKVMASSYSPDFRRLEIVAEPVGDTEGLDISNLFISHDNGKDREVIGSFEDVNELMDLSVGELFADYLNRHY